MATPFSSLWRRLLLPLVPSIFVPGFIGKMFGVIPIIVIATLAISWIECLHLTRSPFSWKKGSERGIGLGN